MICLQRPNNSFKPNLLRYTNNMAGRACHVVASATQVGLTQALGSAMNSSVTEDLENVLNMLRPFDERRERAKERLEGEQFGHAFFFAVLGLSTSEELLAIDSVASLRQVSDPPGEIELAGAMSNKAMMSAVRSERRGGKECVSTFRSRWTPEP